MLKTRIGVIPYSYLAIAGVLLAVQVGTLWALGQPWISASGKILLWSNNPLSPETSQQLADWYSLSHIVHGFLFYGLLKLVCPKLPLGLRLLLAMGLEISWEIAENTPMVIQAYRQQALAIGYTGDSILNSLMDTLMMALGFFIAFRLSWRWTLTLAILFEIGTLIIIIRDNLALNILMLVSPIDAIRAWQAAL